jgi:FAD/FMN-containing dehydrogenase
LPAGDKAFLVDVLSTASDTSAAKAMTASNRGLYERNRLRGGTLYPIGAVPLTPDDWKQHFGPRWEALSAAKARFDPHGVLTPGPGIF